MKLGKYILILPVLAAGLAGCLHDEPAGPVEPETEELTTLSFAVPSASFAGVTRAADDVESEIKCLDMFLINMSRADHLVEKYIRITDVSEIRQAGDYKTFKVDLSGFDDGSLYKIILFANGSMPVKYGDIINLHFTPGWGTMAEGVTTESELIHGLQAQFPNDPTINGITMWGQTEQVFSLPAEVPTIQMIRACAKLDVTLDPSLAGMLDIHEVRVENMNSHFCFAPYAGEEWNGSDYTPEYNYSHTTLKVTAASLASSFFLTDRQLSRYNDTFSGYVTEHIIDPDTEMVLIVRGVYNGSNEGYYKIRLLDEDGEPFEILRNHRYTVNITGVAGPGYGEDELDDINTYLQAEVREWNDTPQRVTVDGEYYLEVSHTTVDIHLEAGWMYLDVETNFPGTGDRSGKDVNNMPAGAFVNKIDGIAKEFIITEVDDGDSNPGTLRLKLEWDEWTDSDAWHVGFITVTAGNMNYVVNLYRNTSHWLSLSADNYAMSLGNNVVSAPLDGGFHEFRLNVNTTWNSSGGRYNTAIPWEMTVGGPDADKYIPVTTSSAGINTSRAVYFRTASLPDYEYTYEAELTFTSTGEYHYTPVTISVVLGNPRGESNSYILPLGKGILIPVSKANNVVNGSVLNVYESSSSTMVWSDHNTVSPASNISKMMVSSGLGSSALLYVKAGSSEGNAVVGIKTPRTPTDAAAGISEDEVIRWSWHIWVTDYDPDATAQTFVSPNGLTVTTMDRALGAMAATPGDPATEEGYRSMQGLFYQWGRKDPFPLDTQEVPIYGGANMQAVTIDAGDIGVSAKNSIIYPLRPAKTVGWQGITGLDTSWGGYRSKAVIADPCPEGWKVPYYNYWGKTDTAGDPTKSSDVNLGAYNTTIGSVPGNSSLWWLHWPGYGGYFPGGGLRPSGNFYIIGNLTWGYQWSAIKAPGVSTDIMHTFSYAKNGSNNSGIGNTISAKNIRCVKEPATSN